MSDVDVAEATTAEAPIAVMNVPEGDKMDSVRSAARLLQSMRRPKEAAAPVEVQATSTQADEPTEITPDAETYESPHVETTEAPDPAVVEEQQPTIEPPRSWTAEAKDAFNALPPEHRQAIVDRERTREVEFRRSQDEIAEARKVVQTERDQATQARQQYESALPVLLQTLQSQQAGEFSDIKTMDDVTRLARDDWPRYIQWDAGQKKLAAVQQEMQASQQRQAQEQSTQWTTFAQKEDALFAEKAPEIADPVKGPRLRDSAVAYLKALGFTDDEMSKNWSGQEKVSLRDHRIQQLILNGVQLQSARKNVREAPKKPVPPVQRPGVAQSAGAAQEHALNTLNQKLSQTGSLKAATELRLAQMQAQRRR